LFVKWTNFGSAPPLLLLLMLLLFVRWWLVAQRLCQVASGEFSRLESHKNGLLVFMAPLACG